MNYPAASGKDPASLKVARKFGPISSDEGLTLEKSASLPLHGGNLTHINLFDTKFKCFIFPPTRCQGLFN